MTRYFLDFEQPIAELELRLEELRRADIDLNKLDINLAEEISRLEAKLQHLMAKIYDNLTDWQIVKIARHPDRPYSLDYIEHLFTDFQEFHGDRCFSDDAAIVGGTARLNGQPVMVIGQQKGRTTNEKILRNFGMPNPEGYRKALRLMLLAQKFKLPIITLIDTPGAYPGVGAEARGQSEAIAYNLKAMFELTVPIIAVIIGEGCSGGALGIGIANKVLMLQYAYYATISPEGCATILWKDAKKAEEAADIMHITADKLLDLSIIDNIIDEPLGGAHKDLELTSNNIKTLLTQELAALNKLTPKDCQQQRYDRFMKLGKI